MTPPQAPPTLDPPQKPKPVPWPRVADHPANVWVNVVSRLLHEKPFEVEWVIKVADLVVEEFKKRFPQ